MTEAKWKNRIVRDDIVDARTLTPNPINWRRHPKDQRAALNGILGDVGWVGKVLVNETTGHVLDGHARTEEAIETENYMVPVTYVRLTTDEEQKVLATYDPIGAMADTDTKTLRTVLTGVQTDDPGLAALLKDLKPTAMDDPRNAPGALADTFGAPPFSVLDTRRGYWQDRKNTWRKLIQDNAESRAGLLGANNVMASIGNGTSILDPVLAELMVSWFGMRDGIAFDPFAGDTVFGYVAASKGMRFRGIELREEQAILNQGRCDAAGLDAQYFCDDSQRMDSYIEDNTVDLVFSCPPYADLEVYSDDPRDLSTMSHDAFFEVYADILARTYPKLKPNRFAIIVTSEVRDSRGAYIGLVPKTIDIMQGAGYTFHNDMVLIGVAGTLPLRSARTMRATRRTGRQHQNALVFAKGDPGKAAQLIQAEALAEYQATKGTTPDHENVLVFLKGEAKTASGELGPIMAPLPVEAES